MGVTSEAGREKNAVSTALSHKIFRCQPVHAVGRWAR